MESYRPILSISKRHLPDFGGTTYDRQTASYEDLLRLGLQERYDSGIGVELWSNDKYAIFTFPSTAPYTDYHTILNCFPRKGVPTVHFLDEIPNDVRSKLINAIYIVTKSQIKTLQQNGLQVQGMYLLQHNGSEINRHPFNTTIQNAHFHLFPTWKDMSTDTIGISEIKNTLSYKNTYHDPTFQIANDLLSKFLEGSKIDKSTSSIALSDKEPAVKDGVLISCEEEKLLSTVMSNWRGMWHEVAGCFITGKTDCNQRYLIRSYSDRKKFLEDFLEKHPELSDHSKRLLVSLGEHITNADPSTEQNIWHMFHNGPAGSWGISLFPELNRRIIRWAPRTRVVEHKWLGVEGVFIATERSVNASFGEIESFIKIQKQLTNNIRALI